MICSANFLKISAEISRLYVEFSEMSAKFGEPLESTDLFENPGQIGNVFGKFEEELNAAEVSETSQKANE